MKMHANKQNPIDFIEAGDIGAAVGFKDIKTGDTLCDENHPITLGKHDHSLSRLSLLRLNQKHRPTLIKWVWQSPNWWKKILHLRVKTDEETGQTIFQWNG